MRWIAGGIIIWIISKWLTRKPKPVAVEEYHEPPEFESIGTGVWTRPPSDRAAARAQRQLDSSGLGEI